MEIERAGVESNQPGFPGRGTKSTLGIGLNAASQLLLRTRPRLAWFGPQWQVAGVMVWGLGVVIISAPQVFLRPRVGLDASWEVAMQMASRLGLQWGTQIAWTYGPYGYTDQAIYVYFRTWLLSAVVAVVVHVLYCGVLGLFLWQAKIGIWGW